MKGSNTIKLAAVGAAALTICGSAQAKGPFTPEQLVQIICSNNGPGNGGETFIGVVAGDPPPPSGPTCREVVQIRDFTNYEDGTPGSPGIPPGSAPLDPQTIIFSSVD